MTQTALVFEPAPVAARRCNDPATIESRFADFDRAHPEVWRAFVELAFAAVNAGAARAGAKDLVEDIRKQLGRDISGPGPRINNDYTALYARKWAQHYPEHRGLFRYRRRAGDVQR